MWNQPLQQNWGWPSNPNTQFNQNQQDHSQGWAAAAALWVQQKQHRPDHPPTQLGAPPAPPGPPPPMPPLPPPDDVPLPLPVEILDYNHGHQNGGSEQHSPLHYHQSNENAAHDRYNREQQADNITSHVKSEILNNEDKTKALEKDVFDYNHGKINNNGGEIHQDWGGGGYNNQEWFQPPPMPPTMPDCYNNDWVQWGGVNGQQDNNWNGSQSHYQDEEFSHQNADHQRHFQAPPPQQKQFNSYENQQLQNNSPDPSELVKKTKSLPLWLRLGLEQREKSKKGDDKKSKKKSEYHPSPGTSPEKTEEERGFGENATEDSTKDLTKESLRIESDEEEEEDDEEEKQRKLMLKIKTWMTETLLGVTNTEIKSLCSEVYFEIKRSAKVKATQLRKSGGLEALRSGIIDDDDHSASESEEEQPAPKKSSMKLSCEEEEKPPTQTPREISPEPLPPKKEEKNASVVKTKFTERRGELLKAEIQSLDKLIQARKEKAAQHTPLKSQRIVKKDLSNRTVNRDSSDEHLSDNSSSKSSELTSNNDNKKRRKSHKREIVESDSNSDESDVTDDEDQRRKKKFKSRRSESRHKKSKRKHKHRDSSSESDYKKKKRKKKEKIATCSSSDESRVSSRRSKTKGKRRSKHKTSSQSRSPRRSKHKK